jgi:hypothetical protein
MLTMTTGCCEHHFSMEQLRRQELPLRAASERKVFPDFSRRHAPLSESPRVSFTERSFLRIDL